MEIHITAAEILFLLSGLFFCVFGILLFMGQTRWGQRTYQVGNIPLTSELLGFVLFLLGIVLMLVFFIPVLGPRLSSQGIS